MRLFSVLLLCACNMWAALAPGVWENPLLLMIPSDKGTEVGSGFLYSHSNGVFLVTARHVVYNPSASNTWVLKGTNLVFSCFVSNKVTPRTGSVDLGSLEHRRLVRAHPERDVAVMQILVHSSTGPASFGPHNGNAFATFEDNKVPQLTHRAVSLKLEDVEPGETSYVLGYPTSVTTKIPDVLDPRRPLVRQALISDVDRVRKHIVLDCAVYKGNSGGPVLVERRNGEMFTVGLVSKFVPFPEEWQNAEFGFKYVTTSNSGYAIVEPLDAVFALMDEIQPAVR